jgi:hypothetical protein
VSGTAPGRGALAPRAAAVWLLPAVVAALALVVDGRWPIAIGIGLAGGLSLAGSV